MEVQERKKVRIDELLNDPNLKEEDREMLREIVFQVRDKRKKGQMLAHPTL